MYWCTAGVRTKYEVLMRIWIEQSVEPLGLRAIADVWSPLHARARRGPDVINRRLFDIGAEVTALTWQTAERRVKAYPRVGCSR